MRRVRRLFWGGSAWVGGWAGGWVGKGFTLPMSVCREVVEDGYTKRNVKRVVSKGNLSGWVGGWVGGGSFIRLVRKR